MACSPVSEDPDALSKPVHTPLAGPWPVAVSGEGRRPSPASVCATLACGPDTRIASGVIAGTEAAATRDTE